MREKINQRRCDKRDTRRLKESNKKRAFDMQSDFAFDN